MTSFLGFFSLSTTTLAFSSVALNMNSFDTTTTTSSPTSVSSYSSPPPPPIFIISPCAACKILRRRCVENCILAPYFPPSEPLKFSTAHKVFGASNIIKFLQELPETHRADAVSSLVYEANARIRDPVYGCAGVICHLQKQMNDLQGQLAKAQAQLVNLQFQNAKLTLIYMEMVHSQQWGSQQSLDNQSFINTQNFQTNDAVLENNDACSTLEALWT